jgi:DNA-binding MarR family transcriptional regulator
MICSEMTKRSRRAADEDTLPIVYERRILTAIRRIIRSVDIYSHKLELTCGVTVPQLSCLLRIVESGPLTLKDLSAEASLSPSTLVGIVDRLEHKGLALRTRSVKDRRQVLISATEEGVILASEAPSPLQDRLANALDELPEIERAAITLSMERIVELMEIRQVDAAPILETGVSLHNASAQGRTGESRSSAAKSAAALQDE